MSDVLHGPCCWRPAVGTQSTPFCCVWAECTSGKIHQNDNVFTLGSLLFKSEKVLFSWWFAAKPSQKIEGLPVGIQISEPANGKTPSFSSPRQVLKLNLKGRPDLASPLPSTGVCPTWRQESRIPSLGKGGFMHPDQAEKEAWRLEGHPNHTHLLFNAAFHSGSKCFSSLLLLKLHPGPSDNTPTQVLYWKIQNPSDPLQRTKGYTSVKDTQHVVK